METLPQVQKQGVTICKKESAICSERVTELLSKYPDEESLLNVFNPCEQAHFSTFEKRCYRGIAPTLSEVSALYGYNTTKAWMMAQLFNLSEFTNKKNVLSNDLIEELSELIINRYHFLKLTEMMLFFFRLKNSDYEEFYGEVSTLTITRSLKTFLRDRNIAHEKYDCEERLARSEKESKGGISREEYERGIAEGKYKRFNGHEVCNLLEPHTAEEYSPRNDGKGV